MPETKRSNPQVTISRVFDAPRSLVFKAWTDPKRLAQWWGPYGFTSPLCEADARPGGAIRIDMCGPDGTTYPMTGTYQEIQAPERIVFTSSAMDSEGKPMFEVTNTVTFTEIGNKTKLTLHAEVTTSTENAAPRIAGMNEGWKQSIDCLEDYVGLTSDATAYREMIATRSFDAPRELVFKLWTDPKHVANWWGPDGFTLTIHEMDVRPGGTWRFVMHGPDGVDYQNHIVFTAVIEPERLEYDHTGGASFHTTVIFADEGGKTRLTMYGLFPSEAERDRVVRVFHAIEGQKQHLNRLQQEVARSQS